MARKTNPVIGCGGILLLVGFIILMIFDLVTGVIIMILGFVLAVIGLFANVFSALFGAGDQDGPSQIIITGDKPADKEPEEDDGYNPDVPAWLREPKKKKKDKKGK